MINLIQFKSYIFVKLCWFQEYGIYLPRSTKDSQSIFWKKNLFDIFYNEGVLHKSGFITFFERNGHCTTFKFKFKFPANFLPLISYYLVKIN